MIAKGHVIYGSWWLGGSWLAVGGAAPVLPLLPGLLYCRRPTCQLISNCHYLEPTSVQPILKLFEMFTRFATIGTAISGRSFVDSAKHTFSVLKRNFLQTFSLWWVAD